MVIKNLNKSVEKGASYRAQKVSKWFNEYANYFLLTCSTARSTTTKTSNQGLSFRREGLQGNL